MKSDLICTGPNYTILITSKFLDLPLYNDFSWDLHVNIVLNKIKCELCAIRKTSGVCVIDTLKLIQGVTKM